MARPRRPRDRLRACQTPRVRIVPDGGVRSDGRDACLLCSEYWFTPDTWQESVITDWLWRDEHDRLIVITAGLSLPRQNGKNGCVEALEFYLLLCDPDAHILHTAHRVKTAKKAFQRLCRVFEHKGEKWAPIRAKVDRIRKTNGEEAIFMKSGASIEYSARSKSGGRGWDNITLVIYDEAQELTEDQLEAINATMAASATGDRQAIYTGTPPGPNIYGTVFRKRRTAALNNPTAHTSWHEWGIEELPPESITWEEILPMVYETNPSMELPRPASLSEEFTHEEFDSMTLDGFARERLAWWMPEVVNVSMPAIEAEVWDKSAIPEIARKYQGITTLGVKFSTDGQRWALAGCKCKRNRSSCAFELIEIGDTVRGTRPLAEAIAKRKNKVAVVWIDGANGADSLCANLADYRLPKGFVQRMGVREVIASTQMMVDAMVDGTAKHATVGQELLDECASVATRREIGKKGGWGIDGSIELEACAQAVYGARTTNRDPSRKQVVLA